MNYSEIIEMPNEDRLYIHYEKNRHPVWIEHFDLKTNISMTYIVKKLGKSKIFTRKNQSK
jgi:hypothetical protein